MFGWKFYCNVYLKAIIGEKDRYVCRPSRENGVHDGFDKRKQAVKLADVYGIEKVWGAYYEAARQHGDFSSKKSNLKCQDILKKTRD